MHDMKTRGAMAVVRAIGLSTIALVMSQFFWSGPTVFAQEKKAEEKPSFQIDSFGIMPRPSVLFVLLSLDSVRDELKLTDAKKQEVETVVRQQQQKLRQARRDRAKFQESRAAILKESGEAMRAAVSAEQFARLDQIQLQGQGPTAFSRTESDPLAFAGPPIVERLKLTEEQIRRVEPIVQEGLAAILKAASFPITLDTKSGPPSSEAIGKYVDSPQFQEAEQKARRAARETWAAVTRRIEGVLTDSQRAAYRKALGEPFAFAESAAEKGQARQFNISMVGMAFNQGGGGGGGGGGGQRADPDFNLKVARPAYAGASKHPRVLFDEAHHNFHTSGGRYKPFAGLIANDGYEVIPNREKLSREVLARGEVLIIANALGAEGMGQPGAADPAFTDAECDAIRGWLEAGGSLLLITDHAPMGSAARSLGKRIGVDLSTGATADPEHSEGGETSLVFTRQNHLLGDHPITRGRDDSERVNRVQTFTGTSLKGPEGSVPILKLADTARDMSFDGDAKDTSAAGRAQGIAFALGKGRVVVMGEAAELSAQLIGIPGEKFGMNVPGLDNRQMALNIMHWLSGILAPRAEARKKAG